ncbi:MAG: glycosyltransferase family 4 protein [Bacteroidetes bacterium]|nr:glycosyltransferase family 4 protein [Bacteroidota bacterium]
MSNNKTENSKQIAFVSNSAWSVYNFRLDVIRYLRQQGYGLIVIAPGDDYSSLLMDEGCEFINIQFNNRSENPLLDLKLYIELKKIYAQKKPAFIFHYVIKPNIYGSLAAAACAIKSAAVVTGLGYSFARKNWLYKIVRSLYKRALRKTNEVWFLNNEDAKAFISEKIVDIKKTKVLPGEGINVHHFSHDFGGPKRGNARFAFLMSARLLRSKGLAVYADAARIIRNKGYDADFDLIGFFEEHHPDSIAEQELKQWEEEGLVKHHGFAKDVRPYLENADCFVFPSFYNEGVPRCLMEAASMELPIITSLNRGCKEVVLNNSNGYICNPNDPFDLADKMEKMMALSPEERERMGKNGRLLVMKKFNVESVIKEYEKTLRNIY